MGNIVYAGCQWGMLVVLAKLTSTETLGRFALGMAITAPIILFSQLQLDSIQATDAEDDFELGHYLALRLVTTILAICIIAGVVLIGDYLFESALVILAVGFSKSIESVSLIFYGLMQRHERMDRIACSKLIKGPLSLITLGCVVWITGDLFWGIIGYSVIWGLMLLVYDQSNAIAILRDHNTTQAIKKIKQIWIRPIFNRQKLLQLTRLALPLGAVMALLSLNFNLPRFFIESHFDEHELGVFAALAYLVVAGSVVVTAVGQSAVPRLATYYTSGEFKLFKRLMQRLIGIGFIIGAVGIIGAILLGKPLLKFLYLPEYAEHAPVLIWLMCAGAVTYVAAFLGYGMTATRNFIAQLPLLIIVTITTFTFSFFLIPKHALIGAALSLTAGALVQIVGSGIIVFHALADGRRRKSHA